MVMATIDEDMAEFRLQDGRIFRILRTDHQSNFKAYIWDTDDLSWSETEFLGEGGERFYRDALRTFMSVTPFG